jgi:nitronate monooxygenase
MSQFQSRITSLLGIRYPIILAPMGGVSGGELAAAVSEAGGLGLVGASYGDPEWMKRELGHVAGLECPWGVGLVMFTVAKRFDLLDLALSFRPDVVALSFGDPAPFIEPIRNAGARILIQVHNIKQARDAVAAGADALIVQGAEAGGHSWKRATLPLAPAVRDAVGPAMPIIVAGGIADGRGMAAALTLGGDAAMLGTRFFATSEALGSPDIKRRLIEGHAEETVRTRAFDIVRGIDWPPQYSGRALENEFSRMWVAREAELSMASDAVRTAYADAVRNDDLHIRAVWAGEAVDMINSIQPARTVIDDLMREAEASLALALRSFAPEAAIPA